MPRVNPEVKKWTIPSDWDEETDGYMCYLICLPNSRQWRGIFDGLISTLAYGRNWNRLSGTITDVQAIAREVFESMCAAPCAELLEKLNCICEAVTTTAETGQEAGTLIDPPFSNGEVTVGPGEQFPDIEAYLDAKCNVSNGIFDTIRDTVEWLENNNTQLLTGLFGGVTSGLIVALALSGPVGWAIAGVTGTIAGMAAYLIASSIAFADLKTAMNDRHDEAVLALYDGGDAVLAKDAFIAAIAAGSPTPGAVELGLLDLMVSAQLVNQLFDPRPALADYQSPDPSPCVGWSHTFDFTISDQGWTNDVIGGFPFGVYDPGVGWKSVWGAVGPSSDERLAMRLTGFTSPVAINSIRVIYILTGSCGPLSSHFMQALGGVGSVVVGSSPLPCALGSLDETGVGAMTTPTDIVSGMNGDAGFDGGAEFTLTSVTLTGTGTDPF